MVRKAFAIAVMSLVFAAASGVSYASPAAPLPAGVVSAAASGDVTQARCGWHCRHHWRHRHHWCRRHHC